MNTPSTIGKCKLCLRDPIPLHDSHILPAWAYRRARGSSQRPVVVGDNGAVLTDKQDQEPLLCTTCENRFGGRESVVAKYAYAEGRPSPLVVAVKEQNESTVNPMGRRFYAGEIDPQLAADFGYFALSVVWRMTVATIYRSRRVHLGPFQDPVREYLVGDSPLAANIAVALVVYDDTPSPVSLVLASCTPVTQRIGQYHRHSFNVAGLHFEVAIGKATPRVLQKYCLISGERKRVFVMHEDDISFGKQLLEIAADAPAHGMLANRLPTRT